MLEEPQRSRLVTAARDQVAETPHVVHAGETELFQVATDRRLGRVEAEGGQARADLLLTGEPLARDQREDRLLPFRLHRAVALRAAHTSAPSTASANAFTASATSSALTVNGGDIRTTSGPASVASTPPRS